MESSCLAQGRIEYGESHNIRYISECWVHLTEKPDIGMWEYGSTEITYCSLL